MNKTALKLDAIKKLLDYSSNTMTWKEYPSDFKVPGKDPSRYILGILEDENGNLRAHIFAVNSRFGEGKSNSIPRWYIDFEEDELTAPDGRPLRGCL